MNMAEKLQPVVNLSYEQAFAELEKIVLALESEEHNLDEALAQFERGQILAKHCNTLLDKAELRVHQISGEEEIPFDIEEA
jgi:exodeoxyribonuclease VII small subunit